MRAPSAENFQLHIDISDTVAYRRSALGISGRGGIFKRPFASSNIVPDVDDIMGPDSDGVSGGLHLRNASRKASGLSGQEVVSQLRDTALPMAAPSFVQQPTVFFEANGYYAHFSREAFCCSSIDLMLADVTSWRCCSQSCSQATFCINSRARSGRAIRDGR